MLLRFPWQCQFEGDLRVLFSKKIYSLVREHITTEKLESEHVHLPVFMASLARPAREESLISQTLGSTQGSGSSLRGVRHEKVDIVGLTLLELQPAASNCSLSFSTVPWRHS